MCRLGKGDKGSVGSILSVLRCYVVKEHCERRSDSKFVAKYAFFVSSRWWWIEGLGACRFATKFTPSANRHSLQDSAQR